MKARRKCCSRRSPVIPVQSVFHPRPGNFRENGGLDLFSRFTKPGDYDLPVMPRVIRFVAVALALHGLIFSGPDLAGAAMEASASSSAAGFPAGGAADGRRFATETNAMWAGAADAGQWWWQVRFDAPREIGAILQVIGDHEFVLRHTPRSYVWQASNDGAQWTDLRGTAIESERRLFRVHRLAKAIRTRFLRLQIHAATGKFPALREVELFSSPTETVPFDDWIVAVNTTHDPKLPGHGQEFIPLAKSCDGWQQLQAQQVWLDSFDERFLAIEPRPLTAFLSGNFKDWCEVNRELWRGVQGVLREGRLPMWASCGGAQGLAILAEAGVDKPWDCPHCRDPKNPKTPIYAHIGHTGMRPCGDYSACIFERGPHRVKAIGDDPVFRGLPGEFQVMESHCGQIEWPPAGWSLIATAGQGSRSRTQCLRVDGRPIYAAQFHIEMAGTPETSRRIMSNFLGLAKSWRDGGRQEIISR